MKTYRTEKYILFSLFEKIIMEIIVLFKNRVAKQKSCGIIPMYIGKSVDGKSSAWEPSRENGRCWKPFMEEMYENHS